MSADVTSLAKARAHKADDCRLWTPLDALRDLVAEIEAGRIKPEQLVIHYMEEREGGGQRHHYQAAGVTFPQHIALLEVAKHRVINEWLV